MTALINNHMVIKLDTVVYQEYYMCLTCPEQEGGNYSGQIFQAKIDHEDLPSPMYFIYGPLSDVLVAFNHWVDGRISTASKHRPKPNISVCLR